eukprot:EC125127.1.p1 GENE.EC125127.1~~EC125127.1.p1  ORF type:complete len:207 (-),score=23.13 EC125127.1:89-709(-)
MARSRTQAALLECTLGTKRSRLGIRNIHVFSVPNASKHSREIVRRGQLYLRRPGKLYSQCPLDLGDKLSVRNRLPVFVVGDQACSLIDGLCELFPCPLLRHSAISDSIRESLRHFGQLKALGFCIQFCSVHDRAGCRLVPSSVELLERLNFSSSLSRLRYKLFICCLGPCGYLLPKNNCLPVLGCVDRTRLAHIEIFRKIPRRVTI